MVRNVTFTRPASARGRSRACVGVVRAAIIR
jgi:hypothetical protein